MKRDYFYCLVAGSRGFNDYQLMCNVLDHLLQNKLQQKKYIVIVSGGARGADSLAKRYAQEHGYQYHEFPANWDKYGKSAGYVRNREMHLYISAPDNDRGVVAFWSTTEQSKGTKHNFELARKYSNPIRVYDYSNNRFLTQEEIQSYE